MRLLLLINAIVLVIFSLLLGRFSLDFLSPEKESRPLSLPKELEYANLLLSKGLKSLGAQELENYIKKAPLTERELSKICYRLGNIYMDLYNYKQALKYFYKAEFLNKNAEFKEELNQKIVACLENLGMSQQAKYELKTRASLNLPKEKSPIIARIGEKVITEQEINQALDSLPPYQRKYFEGERKIDFIRSYIAKEIISDKAKRLGLDREPDFLKNVEEYKKEVLFQKMVEKELKEKLKVSPEELKIYYDSNKENYWEKVKAKVSYLSFSKKEEEQKILEEIKEGKAQELKEWIYQGSSYIPQLGESSQAVEEIFSKKKGEITSPVKIGDKFYIFRIEDIVPSRIKSFEEVKDILEQDYRFKKKREIINSMLEEALEEEEVEIFYQEDKKDEPKSDS